jgi:hypothetical protein
MKEKKKKAWEDYEDPWAGLGHGLSGKAPVLQAQGPDFKPQYCQKEKQNQKRPLKHHERANSWTVDIKEMVQTKAIDNVFNKIIAENLPSVEKDRVIYV